MGIILQMYLIPVKNYIGELVFVGVKEPINFIY